MKEVVERSADLMQNLSAITKQASDVLTDMRNGRGLAGQVSGGRGRLQPPERLAREPRPDDGRRSSGKGNAGQLVTNDEMYNRVDSVAGRVDNVLEAVQNKQGTLGKLVYDSDIHDSAKKLIDNGNALLADVRGRQGHARKTRDRRLACSTSTSRWAKISPGRRRN